MSSTSSFPMNTRQLRIVQIACILLALSASVLVAGLGKSRSQNAITPIHWLIILAAIYTAASAFTLQKKLTKGPVQSQQEKDSSTVYRRWRAGHIVRLSFPVSVVMWGAVLSTTGGPLWMAYFLCGLGVFLLLIWSPGTGPAQ